mmetsp:Transcript_57431/g.117561  ORF Transcript_57431/g.117561 Transcript_57431/m.117561 type:complete len:541 (-) Transcript_57431:47-1669(-)
MKLLLVSLLVSVTLGLCSQHATVDQMDLNLVREEGGQHPNAHIHGFVLRSVFIHANRGSERSLHRRVLRSDEQGDALERARARHRRRLTQFYGSEREKAIALAKLCLITYSGERDDLDSEEAIAMFPEETMEQLYQANDGVFGTTYQEELKARQAFRAAVHAELNSTGAMNFRNLPEGEDGAQDKLGIVALEFIRDSSTALVFRGTYTKGDAENMQHWLFDWVLEKMTGRMKDAWINDAGLEWDETLEKRSKHSSFIAKNMIRAQYWFGSTSFPSDASKATERIDGLTLWPDDVKKWGYWPITKFLVDQVYKEVQEAGGTLTFSGHSQGGTRAHLASMYLRKTWGVSVPAISFGATGAQCFPRQLGTKSNLLHDVNPGELHPQVVDYAHPLDTYGNALGLEVGRVCYYHNATSLVGSAALRHCTKVWGYPGPTLMYVADGFQQLLTAGERQIKRDFEVCRYLTHTMEGILLQLQQPGVLRDDGNTSGAGCGVARIATTEDAEGLCPVGYTDADFWTFVAVLVLIPIVLCNLCCCCCCFLL